MDPNALVGGRHPASGTVRCERRFPTTRGPCTACHPPARETATDPGEARLPFPAARPAERGRGRNRPERSAPRGGSGEQPAVRPRAAPPAGPPSRHSKRPPSADGAEPHWPAIPLATARARGPGCRSRTCASATLAHPRHAQSGHGRAGTATARATGSRSGPPPPERTPRALRPLRHGGRWEQPCRGSGRSAVGRDKRPRSPSVEKTQRAPGAALGDPEARNAREAASAAPPG